MSMKIRLSRNGAKKHACYRIVVADSRNPRDGRFHELIGTYDPASNPPKFEIKKERFDYWMGRGATPTATISTLLKKTQGAV